MRDECDAPLKTRSKKFRSKLKGYPHGSGFNATARKPLITRARTSSFLQQRKVMTFQLRRSSFQLEVPMLTNKENICIISGTVRIFV